MRDIVMDLILSLSNKALRLDGWDWIVIMAMLYLWHLSKYQITKMKEKVALNVICFLLLFLYYFLMSEWFRVLLSNIELSWFSVSVFTKDRLDKQSYLLIAGSIFFSSSSQICMLLNFDFTKYVSFSYWSTFTSKTILELFACFVPFENHCVSILESLNRLHKQFYWTYKCTLFFF